MIPKNNISKIRKSANIKQSELASLMKVSTKTISRWENSETELKPYQAEKLADYFNVSLSYLFDFSDSPEGNDKPTGFDSVEEYEKAKKVLLEKIANDPNSKQIGIAHGADGKEKLIPNIGTKKEPFFVVDYSMLIDFKYDEEGLSETKLKTLDIYNELNTEYKKMLFINAIDLIDESKEKDILKMADNIKSTQIADENDRKIWLEEMKLAHSQDED